MGKLLQVEEAADDWEDAAAQPTPTARAPQQAEVNDGCAVLAVLNISSSPAVLILS